MKTVALTLAVLVAAAGPVAAQPPAHHQDHHRPGMMESPWRELNAFHSLLHKSHQPLMASNDLGPARQNAALLAKAADGWSASTAPAECHAAADLGDKVTALAVEARAFADLVAKNGGDEEVKAALGKIHDQFRIVHRGCMPMKHSP